MTVLAAESNFLVPNATFFVEVVAFGIILGVLWRYVIPPIQRAIVERQERIQAEFDEARDAKERAEQAEAEHKASLDEARAEASRIREEARAKGRQIIEEQQTKAQQEADRELAHGRQHLTTERDLLVREVRAGVGELAVALAGRIVGQSVADEARTQELVEQFLAQADAPVTAAAGEGL